MGTIDLHVHTNASDGKYTPAELVALAAGNGLNCLAVTDHDTTDGLSEALQSAENYPELTVIPGVEISSHAPGSEVHILGYFIDRSDHVFAAELAAMRDSRRERARLMVDKLRTLGLDITHERVRDIAGESNIGRPHIAQALLEKGYVTNMQEVFSLYLGQGRPAYVDRHKLSPAQAVELISKAGGLPVIAHPTTINDMEKLIPELIAVGLVGMEVYYKDYDAKQRRSLAAYARANRLLATGGSDFHGIDPATEVMLGQAGVPQTALDKLLALARQRNLI